MMQSILNRLRLGLLFSMFVSVTHLITWFIMAVVTFVLFRLGLFHFITRPKVIMVILMYLFANAIVGIAVSFAAGRIPLRPVRKVIAAINRLAGGDFSVRLDVKRPPELRELAESFNSMAQELGGIEMLRNDFINSFSHEFKTPIGSIKGFAEMLKYGDPTPEERDEYLDTMIRESKRLSRLSTNILNLSKIENQAILSETSRFDLTEQVRRCILLLEPKWAKKRIELSLDLQEIHYTGNEEMLAQVWLNLVENAVKYTPENGEIDIEMKLDGPCVVFLICDSGCGIDSDALAHIFNKFYQADASHSSDGNGLGLAVVKKIVELHEGTITCQSEMDTGSTFRVTLPIRQ